MAIELPRASPASIDLVDVTKAEFDAHVEQLRADT